MKTKVKTQTKSKVGFGELLFFGLVALGIVLAGKRNSNQGILPEPNYSGYPDYNEDIATAYGDMGLLYPDLLSTQQLADCKSVDKNPSFFVPKFHAWSSGVIFSGPF